MKQYKKHSTRKHICYTKITDYKRKIILVYGCLETMNYARISTSIIIASNNILLKN